MSGMLRPLLVSVLVWISTGCLAERGLERTAAPARTVLKSSAATDESPAKAAESEGAATVDAESRSPDPTAESKAEAGDASATEGGEPESATAAGESKSDEKPQEAKPEDESKDAPEEKPRRPGKIVLDTEYDDRRVGDDQTDAVRAEMGIVDDEALNRYVQSVAIRLLRHAPPRPFQYEFKIVDQTVPNAFALPGGKIYVSRGLLALVGSEDELAGVLGHEITHAAERHAAARIEISRRINPLVMGWMRAARIAAYGRDQERDADRGGQILCAKAGYDPNGIATFLRKLDALERYEIGWSRLPFFLATHPTSPERSALASDRANSLEWTRQPGVADDRPFGHLSIVDGLVLGDDPAGGLFDGPSFVHPEMRFSLRFPEGWQTQNSQQAVAAISPEGDAQATLTLAGSGDDVEKIVDEFLEKEARELKIRAGDRRRIRLGELPAVRLEGRGVEQVMTPAGPQQFGVSMQMTFIAYDGVVYRLALTSIAGSAAKYRGRATAFAMSFRPLDEEAAHSLEVTRLRIARAFERETLAALSTRTRNALELGYTSVLNGVFASTELTRGMPIKIGIAEPYIPRPREAKKQADATSEAVPDAREAEAPRFATPFAKPRAPAPARSHSH